MRVLLRDLTPGQDYLLKFRANDGINVSQWSQIFRMRTNGDVVAPSPVTNLTWVATGESFVGSWTAPTTESNGKPLKDLKNYQVTLTAGSTSRVYYTTGTSFELSLARNAEAFGSIQIEVTITVRACDYTDNKSTPVSKTAVEDTPPVPSAPVVSNTSGLLTVEWNGTTAQGTITPFNLNYVEIHAHNVSNFPTDESTIVGRFEGWISGKQKTVITGIPYGQTTYFRLVGVNKKFRKSNPSVQATGTPERISGLEIEDGSISVDQINFVDQLGGPKSWYETTAPTTAMGVVDGDIWYDKSNQYKPYKRVNGSWVSDPDIGVVSGTRIVAGTITSDQIGTNKIITSSANIGNAVIDAANIGSVNAGTISTGILSSSATVTYGGITQPAFSFDVQGNAIINNLTINGRAIVGSSGRTAAENASFSIRSYNFVAGSAGWTINGDGTVEFGNAVLRGRMATASSGRRIEIGSWGSDTGRGDISWYAPDGSMAFVRAYTETNTLREAIQIGVKSESPLRSNDTLWNRINMNTDEWTNYQSIKHDFSFLQTEGFFVVREMTPNLDFNPSRLFLSSTHFSLFNSDDSGNNALRIGTDGEVYLWLNHVSSGSSVDSQDYTYFDSEYWGVWRPGGQKFYVDNLGQVRIGHGTDSNSVRILNSNSYSSSPLFSMYTGAGYGNMFKVWRDDRGTWTEHRAWDDSVYSGIRASAFVPESDARSKEDIQPVSASMLEAVRGVKPKKYRRIRNDASVDEDVESNRRTVQEAPFEIGLIAQEAPGQIVIGTEETGMGIDLYQMGTMNWGAISELADKHDILAARVAALETKLKNAKGNNNGS